MLWPDLNAPTFVIIHKHERAGNEYGKTYLFSSRAGGSRRQLAEALAATHQGGEDVQFIIYRTSPHKAFTAWARVRDFEETRNEQGDEV